MANALRTGSILTPPDLDGKWSVWSQADDAPGAYFLIPADEEALRTGIKFAVVKATMRRESHSPHLALIRTDPATRSNR